MKKINLKFLGLIGGSSLLAIFLFGVPSALATYIPLPFVPHFPTLEGKTGVEMAKFLIGIIAESVRYVIGAVATLMLVVGGVRLILSRGNEENYDKAKSAILWAIIGLFIFALAGDLSEILTVEHGTFIRDPNVALKQSRLFNQVVEIVLTFIKYIIAAISVLAVVRSGARMVTLGGNEEELAQDKKNLLYGIIGLIFILIASPLVNRVFFKIDRTKFPGTEGVQLAVNVTEGTKLIAQFINIIVSVTGPIAILALIAGGIMYMTAAGEEEKINKAKKIMIWAVIGIAIMFGAFGLVSTFIAGKFEGL